MATNSHEWPTWWRIWLFVNLCIFVVMGNWFTAALSPILGELAGFFRRDFGEITTLITYVLLSIGVANVIAVPVSEYVGKRYTVLGALTLFLACNIWCSLETDYNAFMAARVLGGLGAGIIEALGPLIVAQCFDERQLASAMVIYVLCLGAGSSIGPFIAGQLDNAGYHWHYNFIIIACILGANLVSCIIMFPETIDRNLKPDESSERSSHSDIEKPEEAKHGQEIEHTVTGVTVDRGEETLRQLWIRRSFFFTLPDIKPERNFFLLLIQPWTTMASPAVAVTCITFGLMIAATVIISVVLSGTLQSPPILWSAMSVGLLNLSTIVGYVIGTPLGGITADLLSRRSARRNDGVHVRESRLPAIVPGAIIGPLGIIVVGICLQQQNIWIGLAVGWAMLSVALTASANVMLTYCVDCYPWRATDIGVVVNTLKNVIAFGVGYGVSPWLAADGPLGQAGTMAGLLWFFFILWIPLYLVGPRMRTWSLKYIM